MKIHIQLIWWMVGFSFHNDERNECCPDFSCCNENMNTSKEVKELFVKAYQENDTKTQMGLLGQFLGQTMQGYTDKKIYVSK